jgi:ribosomal-protein-alanine N-acetyltransferase
MSFETPQIYSKRLVMRQATLDEVPTVVRYYTVNAAHLAPYQPLLPPDYLTTEFWSATIAKYHQEFVADTALHLFIFLKNDPDQKIIGNINFSLFQRRYKHSCNLGYNLAQIAQGHGYMTEALEVCCAYVFDSLRLHRIEAQYMPRNQASANVLKRLGFEIEGLAKAYLQIAGAWEDHVLTALINPNW